MLLRAGNAGQSGYGAAMSLERYDALHPSVLSRGDSRELGRIRDLRPSRYCVALHRSSGRTAVAVKRSLWWDITDSAARRDVFALIAESLKCV